MRPPPNNATQDFGQSTLATSLVNHHANGHGDQGRQAKQNQMHGRQDHDWKSPSNRENM
jgi:hypothetical protein